MSLEIVILAAGQGTRMRSALPKVLHPVAGNSMLGHVIHSARQLEPQHIHVVIGHGADVVRERLAADDLNFVLQDKQLGTGHATAQAVPFIKADTVLILYGDVPLIEVETLQRLLKHVGLSEAGFTTELAADGITGQHLVFDNQQFHGRLIVIINLSLIPWCRLCRVKLTKL